MTKLDKILAALAEGDKLRSEIIRDTFHNNMKAATLDYLVAGCDRIYVRSEVRNGRTVEVMSLNPASVGKPSRQAVADTLPLPPTPNRPPAPTDPLRKPSGELRRRETRLDRFHKFMVDREAEDSNPSPAGAAEATQEADMDTPSNREVKLPLVIRDYRGNFWLDDKAVKVERRSDGRWFVVGTDYLVRVENGVAPDNAASQLSPFHADRMLERVTPTNVPLPMAPNPADLGLTPADLHYQKLRQQDKWLAAQGLATVERPAPTPIHEPHCSRNFVGTASCDCKLGRGGA